MSALAHTHGATVARLPAQPSCESAPAVVVRLGAGIEVDAHSVPADLLAAWRAAVTIANPRYIAAVAAGRHPGREPRELSGFEWCGSRVRMPRGALARLRRIAAEHGVQLAFEDQRNSGEALELTHSRELRDYQRAAVDQLARRQQGIARSPAGSGKTSLAIGFVADVRRSTLVLVPTVDLVHQWRAEIREQLGIEAGQIGGGCHDVRPVTIATVAALAQLDDSELAQLHAHFGVLIGDEIHHGASPTWWRVIDSSPARYRLGLSATPRREDGLMPLLEWLVGPQVEVTDHASLIESGRLVPPRIVRLESQFEYDYSGPEDWPGLLDALVADRARNQLIVDSIVAAASEGHVCLALTGRVSHAVALADAIASRGIAAAALHGKTPKKQRANLLEATRGGRLSVLVSTSLADEGLDLPCLSRVFLTFPARAAGRVEQRLGRVMRPAPGKLGAGVVDVVDVHVGVLVHQARKRAAVFRTVLGA